MNEEPKEKEEPQFPYPYPVLRCAGSIFCVYFATVLARMWNGQISNVLLGVGITGCMAAALFLFVTGFKGQRIRQKYAFEQEEKRRNALREQEKKKEL